MRAFTKSPDASRAPRRVKRPPWMPVKVLPPVSGRRRFADRRVVGGPVGGRAAGDRAPFHDPRGREDFAAVVRAPQPEGVVGLGAVAARLGHGLGVAVREDPDLVVDGHEPPARPRRPRTGPRPAGPAAGPRRRPARCAAPGSRRWCRGPRTCSRRSRRCGRCPRRRPACRAGCRLPTAPGAAAPWAPSPPPSWRSRAGRGSAAPGRRRPRRRGRTAARPPARPAGGDVGPAPPRPLPHPRPRNAAIAKPRKPPIREGCEAMRETTPLSSDSGIGPALAGRIVVRPSPPWSDWRRARGSRHRGERTPGRSSYASRTTRRTSPSAPGVATTPMIWGRSWRICMMSPSSSAPPAST